MAGTRFEARSWPAPGMVTGVWRSMAKEYDDWELAHELGYFDLDG